MMTPDNSLLGMIDGKTKLAGSNRMELLLFSLGGRETFGINVFKVREVRDATEVTVAPNVPATVTGLISLRGAILPVIDLARCLNMTRGEGRGKFVITEFSGHTQAFLVGDVDRIVRVDWEDVRSPQSMLAGAGGHITAITELPDGKLVSILDVEQVLAEVIGEEPVPTLEAVDPSRSTSIFFADDSALARRKILEVLDKMKLPHQHATNGREAWERLSRLADQAEAEKVALKQRLGLVLVDAEMPEMDGYVLTRHVKGDRRFEGIPVVMHSSLSSAANVKLGQQVGVDAYVAKFKPEDLAKTIANMIGA